MAEHNNICIVDVELYITENTILLFYVYRLEGFESISFESIPELLFVCYCEHVGPDEYILELRFRKSEN